MAPKFASDIELIRAEAIDAIRALTPHLEVGASSRWGPFFASIGERNYPKAASLYEASAVKGDVGVESALAGVLANLWQARYEEARSAASRLADGATFDGRRYQRVIELIDLAMEVEGTYARPELADARPRVPAKTRFAILHDFRVGSTWMVASLNQHERVICYPEALVGSSAEQQAKLLSLMSTGGLPEIFSVYAVAPKYHPVSPYRKKHIDAVGFKTKLRDIRDQTWFRTFLKDNEFKVVRLYREDVLKQAVSLCNAEKLFSERGQYNVRSGIDERAGPLRLDPERLMEKMNRLREEREIADAFVKTLELPTLSLSYEEILEDPLRAASRLGACLGIDGLTLGTTFAKATSDKLEEAVENWDEIVTSFKGTPYELSEEQNPERRQGAFSRLRKVGFSDWREDPQSYWRDGLYGHPFSDLIQSWFDPSGYLQAYPDVSAVLRHPSDDEALLYHFVNTGFYERRIYRPQLLRGFDADYYREQLPQKLRELPDGELQAHWAYSGVFRGLAGSEATSAALDSPFQVFSIGRVGSHSIAGALGKCGVSNLIHTHSDFEFSEAYRGCCLTFSQLMEVKSRIESRAPVFVISGVRDPAGWLLSMFARLADQGESGLRDLSPQRLRSQLRSQVSFMVNFFRNRLLSPFEVFSRSFDAKAGYGVYENGRNRLLIYRVDRLAEIGQDIGKLLGVPDLDVQPLNRSSGAIDKDLVDSMWAMLFDDGFGDRVLRSDYVRRFFASDEQSLIADQLRGKSLPTSTLAL